MQSIQQSSRNEFYLKLGLIIGMITIFLPSANVRMFSFWSVIQTTGMFFGQSSLSYSNSEALMILSLQVTMIIYLVLLIKTIFFYYRKPDYSIKLIEIIILVLCCLIGATIEWNFYIGTYSTQYLRASLWFLTGMLLLLYLFSKNKVYLYKGILMISKIVIVLTTVFFLVNYVIYDMYRHSVVTGSTLIDANFIINILNQVSKLSYIAYAFLLLILIATFLLSKHITLKFSVQLIIIGCIMYQLKLNSVLYSLNRVIAYSFPFITYDVLDIISKIIGILGLILICIGLLKLKTNIIVMITMMVVILNRIAFQSNIVFSDAIQMIFRRLYILEILVIPVSMFLVVVYIEKKLAEPDLDNLVKVGTYG